MIICLTPLVPSSNLDFPLLRCVGLCRVCTYFLLLDGRPAVGAEAAVRVYLLWPGVVAVALGMLCVRGQLLVAWGRWWCLKGHHIDCVLKLYLHQRDYFLCLCGYPGIFCYCFRQ